MGKKKKKKRSAAKSAYEMLVKAVIEDDPAKVPARVCMCVCVRIPPVTASLPLTS